MAYSVGPEAFVRVHDFVPRHHFAGVAGGPSHDGGERGMGKMFGFVNGLIGADGGHEVDMLLVVGVYL